MNLFTTMRDAAIEIHKCRDSWEELNYQAGEDLKSSQSLPDTVDSEEQLINLYARRSGLHANYNSVIDEMVLLKKRQGNAEQCLRQCITILSHVDVLGCTRTYLNTGYICRASISDHCESQLVVSFTPVEWRLDYHAV